MLTVNDSQNAPEQEDDDDGRGLFAVRFGHKLGKHKVKDE